MPKVKYLHPKLSEQEDRQEATKKLIEHAKIETGLSNHDLAEALGLKYSSFNDNLRNLRFSLDKLVLLAQALKFTEEDAAVILGIKRTVR